jgi:hypothetical protein
LLFGGRSTEQPLNFISDTWVFDGVDWRQLKPSASPVPRQHHVMASGSAGVALFGGFARDGAQLRDTWQWNGATWQQLPTLHSPSSWGIAGMTSRNGVPVVMTFPSASSTLETFEMSDKQTSEPFLSSPRQAFNCCWHDTYSLVVTNFGRPKRSCSHPGSCSCRHQR